MREINIVFEYDYDDVDILLVPNYIANNIETVTQKFFSWLNNPENQKPFLVPYKGQLVLQIGTQAFLWWINNYETPTNVVAEIKHEHVKYDPALPSAHF